MADAPSLDPADRTPLKALSGMLAAHKAYKKDECIPCGAVIKMGFFFDGFGRHRDQDDPNTSRYSNICRLWEAHRHMRDTKRQSMPNQFWLRFYYSGLGTPLNKDAESDVSWTASSAALKVAKKSALSAAESFGRVKEPLKQADVKARATGAAKAVASELSFRPVV